MRHCAALALSLCAALAPARALADPAAEAAQDGFHATPSLFWQDGDHRIDVGLSTRLRSENWEAYTDETDWYTALRTRLRLSYGWRKQVFLVGELQDVQLHGLSQTGTGAIASYRNANGGRSEASSDVVRQLYLELRPTSNTFFRAGRQDVKLDSQEVQYEEPNWRYLRTARLGERLVGTVGWSHVERAYDGLSAGLDVSGVELFGFGARPTQGVYEVRGAYRPLNDVFVGGATLTAKRGTLLPNDEFGILALYYDDQRPTSHGGLAGGVSVTTIGAHWLGIHPCGPGNVDALLWGALQTGRYDDLDQFAGAGIAELGYQLTGVFAKPWLRLGVNVASGDGNPNDGDHHTFFNMLPTNHMYYGFADQLAFENLWDSFVQLRLTPHPMLALNVFAHQFRLMQKNDSRYFGTGAFDESVFGFTAASSNGHRNVGTEYDVVATFTPHKAVTLEAGIAWLNGGAVFQSAQRDAQLGYVSLELRY